MRDLFNAGLPEIKIDRPIRLIELFGGYGSQLMALKRIGADVTSWVLCEFDSYAVRSYNAVHGTDYKTSDIRELHGKDLNIADKDKYVYMMFYSFPCTDLSLAGQRHGMAKGSGTRSGLLWEVERILGELEDKDLPQVLCMENVPQVVSDANIADFQDWKNFLEGRGYHNYLQILNAKDYGVAQNRERCFMFSFIEDIYYEFPEKIKLQKKMKDYLEDEADEKYYLKSEKAQKLINELLNRHVLEEDGITAVATNGKDSIRPLDTAVTVCARDCKGFSESFQYSNGAVVMQNEGKTMNGNVKIICAMRGRNPDNPSDRTAGAHTAQRLEMNGNGVSNTLTSVQKDNLVLERQDRYRIRRLTPLECFRLMDVSDDDARKMLAVNSNTQCCKQAGNSIVVDVLCALFRQLNIKGVKPWNGKNIENEV